MIRKIGNYQSLQKNVVILFQTIESLIELMAFNEINTNLAIIRIPVCSMVLDSDLEVENEKVNHYPVNQVRLTNR